MKTPRLVALSVLLAVAFVPVAHGQLLLSTNDNKVTLVNGAATVVKSPPPDTLTVIDIKAWPPKVVAELDVPGSVVGPALQRGRLTRRVARAGDGQREARPG
jgi:hypothetical protein